jgi:uncharacterized protein YbjT (DUF2867 family)
MIVVAGGTGLLGTRLVPLLAGQDLAVRVLTRNPDRAEHLTGPGVEAVRGDVRDPGSIRQALRGASIVVSAVHGFAGPGRVSPASVDRAGNANLISAAAREGADFILVSVAGASPLTQSACSGPSTPLRRRCAPAASPGRSYERPRSWRPGRPS